VVERREVEGWSREVGFRGVCWGGDACGGLELRLWGLGMWSASRAIVGSQRWECWDAWDLMSVEWRMTSCGWKSGFWGGRSEGRGLWHTALSVAGFGVGESVSLGRSSTR